MVGRMLVAVVGLLLLLAQFGGLLHILLVQHVVCSAHGEIVHNHAPGGPSATVPPGSHDLGVTAVSPDPTETDHDHGCSVLAHHRSPYRVPPAGNEVCAAIPTHTFLSTLWAGATARSPLSVLQFAPKNSPPQVELV